MAAPTVTFEATIPEDVYRTLQAQGLHREALAEQSVRLLALRFYQEHVLSLGKAAKLAGMTLWDFTAFLSRNHVPVIDLDADELAAEFAAVEGLAADLKSESGA